MATGVEAQLERNKAPSTIFHWPHASPATMLISKLEIVPITWESGGSLPTHGQLFFVLMHMQTTLQDIRTSGLERGRCSNTRGLQVQLKLVTFNTFSAAHPCRFYPDSTHQVSHKWTRGLDKKGLLLLVRFCLWLFDGASWLGLVLVTIAIASLPTSTGFRLIFHRTATRSHIFTIFLFIFLFILLGIPKAYKHVNKL